MEEDYNEKIELLADLLNKRLDLVSMRIEVLERAITISHNLRIKLLDIQAEQHFKKKIEKAIERINEEVDYTPCCEHGHKCKSDPVFGIVRFNKVKQILNKLKENEEYRGNKSKVRSSQENA